MLSTRFIKANDEVCDFGHPVPAPYFRKSLHIDSVPKTATITICGLGFYEFHVNGKNITKGPLAPYISNPDDLCYYDAYDVAAELRQGENVIGVLLGNGFRNAFGGFVWDFDQAKSRGPVILALSFDAETGKEGAPLHFAFSGIGLVLKEIVDRCFGIVAKRYRLHHQNGICEAFLFRN